MSGNTAQYQEALEPWLVGGISDKGEQRGFCPLHEDPAISNSPSASFNWENGRWNHVGYDGCGGMIDRLAKRVLKHEIEKPDVEEKHERSTNVVTLNFKQTGDQLPTDDDIERWHMTLLGAPDRLKVMTDERGLTNDTLKFFQVGWDGERYTIPVRDAEGVLQNVRRYHPKAKASKDKMFSINGHGEVRLFHPELLSGYDEVIITEGELDMMVAHQHGLPAVTHTAGAGTFKAHWGPEFQDKDVFIVYDCDDAGRRGAVSAAKRLVPHARNVYIVDMNLDRKGADITDFLVNMGHTAADLKELMQQAREDGAFAARSAPPPVPTAGTKVSVMQSQDDSIEGAIEMVAAITGKQDPPYLVPKQFLATCDQSKGDVCNFCPMATWNGSYTDAIPVNDPTLLEFIEQPDEHKRKVLRHRVGAKCTDHIEFDVQNTWTLEELVIGESVDHRDEDETQAPVSRRAYSVGTYDTPSNTTVRLVGKQMTDPKTQRGLLLAWQLEQTLTALDKFVPTPETVAALRIFQPKADQTPLAKCEEIADDLAANVTHIYGRPELHMAYDLVWHSPLSFNMGKHVVEKGWLELLVMGDTRTGKSEAALQLTKHYNNGVLMSCEGATFAGLVGGVQQMMSKWMVTWGTIPLNDRRLVVLDEVSGLKDKDVIENMSAIRSSGKAQLTKIASAQTSARTRLIWISNPVDGRRISDMTKGGIEAIEQMIKTPEDIARFDLAMTAASEDVQSTMINTLTPPEVPHQYTAELCENLVLWAWSRKRDQVEWTNEAQDQIIIAAESLGKRYVAEPPLVQIENVRLKVARIAAAIAARTFSTNDGETLLVTAEHVKDAVRFLHRIYRMDTFGYARHSQAVLNRRKQSEKFKDETVQYLREHQDVLNALLAVGASTFKVRDFEEFGGMDKYEAQAASRELLEKRMIRRLTKGNIRPEPVLIQILREFEAKEDLHGYENEE